MRPGLAAGERGVVSDYENLQCAAATVCAGDGGDRGLEGIAQSIDRLTFVLGIAVRWHLVVGSDEDRALAEILGDLGESLGVSR